MRETSLLAFAAADEGAQQERIVRDVLAHGPGTTRELAARCGLELNSVRPRVDWLRRAGVLEWIGHRADGLSGRDAFVLAATSDARGFLQGTHGQEAAPSVRSLERGLAEAAARAVDGGFGEHERAALARAVGELRERVAEEAEAEARALARPIPSGGRA